MPRPTYELKFVGLGRANQIFSLGIEPLLDSMKVVYSAATVLIFIFAFCLVTIGVMPRSKAEEKFTSAGPMNCSDGWRITGYYTPVETDFTGTETREIEIRGVGKETFNSEFLQTIFDDDEGYGEWYLGNYNGRWHKSDAPLDANDKPLELNTVAVDNEYIPSGSIVSIPDLPGDLGKLEFKSNDVGVSVHGKHIDVYTGEGHDARRRMYRFTYEGDGKGLQRVCFSSTPGR